MEIEFLYVTKDKFREDNTSCQIQYFQADFLWKVSLKILNLAFTMDSQPQNS